MPVTLSSIWLCTNTARAFQPSTVAVGTAEVLANESSSELLPRKMGTYHVLSAKLKVRTCHEGGIPNTTWTGCPSIELGSKADASATSLGTAHYYDYALAWLENNPRRTDSWTLLGLQKRVLWVLFERHTIPNQYVYANSQNELLQLRNWTTISLSITLDGA